MAPSEAALCDLVPDGVFGIEYESDGRSTYRFFALEADRGTMPVKRSSPDQSSYLGKLATYHEIIAQRVQKWHWGIPNLLVLTVTTSDARIAEISKYLEGQGGVAFVFKAIHRRELSAPMRRLLREPWQRSGLTPLYIDR